MKTIKFFLPAALLLFALSSCKSVVKLVCLPWQVSEVKFKEHNGTLTPEQQRMVEYQLKNEFTFRFRPDSVYLVIKGYDTSYGTWRLSANKKEIITRLYDQEEQISEIVKINKQEFLMHPKMDFGNLEYIKATLPTGTK